jgi:hypothetical protein
VVLPPPPTITISYPLDGATVSSETLRVEGNVSVGASVTLSRATQVDLRLDGSFAADVVLVPGPNVINATAQDEFGQTSEVTITVVFEPPPEGTTTPVISAGWLPLLLLLVAVGAGALVAYLWYRDRSKREDTIPQEPDTPPPGSP